MPVKARPILFSGEMVRALLDGRKSQTRRAIKGLPDYEIRGLTDYTHCNGKWCIEGLVMECGNVKCPYGQPGDLLWVRETWAVHWMYNDQKPSQIKHPKGDSIWYRADGNKPYCGDCDESHKGRWRPSIFTMRWSSRLTLKITDVKVERVQDISEEDAVTEGLNIFNEDDANLYYSGTALVDEWPEGWELNPVEAYKYLWNSINKNWDENPWVWVVEFEVIKQNIDQVLDA